MDNRVWLLSAFVEIRKTHKIHGQINRLHTGRCGGRCDWSRSRGSGGGGGGHASHRWCLRCLSKVWMDDMDGVRVEVRMRPMSGREVEFQKHKPNPNMHALMDTHT